MTIHVTINFNHFICEDNIVHAEIKCFDYELKEIQKTYPETIGNCELKPEDIKKIKCRVESGYSSGEILSSDNKHNIDWEFLPIYKVRQAVMFLSQTTGIPFGVDKAVSQKKKQAIIFQYDRTRQGYIFDIVDLNPNTSYFKNCYITAPLADRLINDNTLGTDHKAYKYNELEQMVKDIKLIAFYHSVRK